MTEQLLHPSAGKFERDGLPIRVFGPEFDGTVDSTARQIVDIGEVAVGEMEDLRGAVMKEAFRYRLLAARTHRQDYIQLADTYRFVYQAVWEATERAKEMLIAEGRDDGSQLRKIREKLEQRSVGTSQNQGI